MKIKQADQCEPYTPFQHVSERGFVVLAHKSLNGIWWSTYKNPVTLEELDGISMSGEWNMLSKTKL